MRRVLWLLLAAVTYPILAVMRADRRARNDADDRWSPVDMPYDDDDSGTDVDEPTEDEIDGEHDRWHDWHGTSCDERPACDAFLNRFYESRLLQ